jgi:hypothetical protein
MLKKYLAMAVMTVLLGFAVNLHEPKTALAEEKKEPSVKEQACNRTLTYCVNDCRNGTKLPLNSSPSAISQCDFDCEGVWIRCTDAAQEFRRKDRGAAGPASGGVLDPGPRKPPKLQPEVAPKPEELIQ